MLLLSMPFVAVGFFFLNLFVLRALFDLPQQVACTLPFSYPLGPKVAMLALTFPAGMLTHEFGHWLAGMVLRQSCRRFVIGPFELARIGLGWKLRLIPLRQAGLVDLAPSTFARFRLQRVMCAAAGPLASLLAGALFLYLAIHARGSFAYLFWTCCLEWAGAGVLNLAPAQFFDAASDGYRVCEALAGGDAFDYVERSLLTPASHATALRVRDWPHDLVRRLALDTTDRFNAYLAYIHFLDRGDPQTAGLHLDRLTAGRAPGDPPEYALEAAFFHALHRHDAATARRWLDSETQDREPWLRIRARAALEQAAGSPETAAHLIDEAIAAIQAYPPCGAYQYELDRLLELRAAAPATR